MADLLSADPTVYRHPDPASENDRQPTRVSTRETGGAAGRWATMLAGGALAYYGVKRRDTPNGWVLAAIGGGLTYYGSSLWKGRVGPGKGIRVGESVTILRPRAELFHFWRNFENLPRIMHNLRSVEVLDATRSHWIAATPVGDVEWDAELHTEKENEMISWRALPGSAVDTAGTVTFTDAPGDRGTEVKVIMRYDSPAGRPGDLIARLFWQSPAQQVRDDLRRFKQIMETGEIPTTEGQPRGSCT